MVSSSHESKGSKETTDGPSISIDHQSDDDNAHHLPLESIDPLTKITQQQPQQQQQQQHSTGSLASVTKAVQDQQTRSRSNSDINLKLPVSSTTLRTRLSRHPSVSSVSDTTNKTKMKLKLQLTQNTPSLTNLQTTPVLLSPRATPTTSPGFISDNYFANYEKSPTYRAFNSPQHTDLDSLLDDSIQNRYQNRALSSAHGQNDNPGVLDSNTQSTSSNDVHSNDSKNKARTLSSSSSSSTSSSTNTSSYRPKLRNSPPPNVPKVNLHPLQTKLQRLPSSSSAHISSTIKSPRSPSSKYKSRSIANQNNEPVRPQTSILKSNINTKFSQQYQQQEKMYLTSITKYRNRYKHADDYYDKSIVPDDVETNNDSSYGLPNDAHDLGKLSIDSEFFNTDDDDYITDRNDKNREYEALKVLSNQIGSDLLSKETYSEYSLDSNILLELLNRNDEIQLQNTSANDIISERLEWQTMLQTVLTGDVVTGEKTKLIKPLAGLESENMLRVGYKEDFWLGIRAKLYGRTEEEQKRLVLYYRGLVDETLDEIMNFRLEFPPDRVDMSYVDKVKFATEKVNNLLDKYERCVELWRTQKEMETDKPQCATPEFINRIDCLVAWTSVTEAVKRESDVLKKWVGNDDLDILRPGSDSSNTLASSNNEKLSDRNDDYMFKDNRPFVENILKEKDIENLFNKRLFSNFSHWTIKAKKSYLEYHEYFNELGLPSYLENLFVLTNFPSNLMKEIIKTRLAYAKKLKNPTMMMIDQILDDLKMYLRLAIEIRISMLEYCAPVEGWISFPDYQDPEFDDAIIQCVNHYMNLLNKKLLFSPKGPKSFRTFKEPEELEKEWVFLQNMGFYINNASIEFSLQISSLFLKLINRLYSFIQHQIQGPPSDGYRLDSQRLIRWYTSSIENFSQMRRKFLRFELHLTQYFKNAVSFKVLPQRTQRFFALLKEYDHALYHNPKIAEDGIYIFVSESLVNRPYDVECILKSTYSAVDFTRIPERHLDVIRSYHPSIQYYNTKPDYAEPNNDLNLDYVIVIVPPKALMWDGPVIPFENIDKLPLGELPRGSAMLLTKGGPDINVCETFGNFKQIVDDTIGSTSQTVCSIPKLEENFQSSSKLFSRITCLIIDCTPAIRNQCRGVGNCQELVNNVFIFSRDVGKDSIRNSTLGSALHSNRAPIILRMIKLAIEWLSFIVDDCSPTDPKTFRWSVAALEFATEVTRGFNILTLDSEKFYRLKDKVAGCMSLLIAHFDIMGARANELQKTRMQTYQLKSQKDIYTLDDESLGSLRAHIMHQIGQIEGERRTLQVEQKSVGRVLDNTDMENQLLTYLASSFSSVSIRWQKGKFLGGGTFGSVFACVNLDTGGPMAVKEIRFQDRQSIKTIVPAIKGEMSVLELLSHPNIVQFFGVEVHRDRVYIFMEYCSGGSLAGLLEYGRIEDEIVIQLYTLQMLEGLTYLHQFGIVHRDVKPENILLDHMGVIKFVDFGSAKVISITNSNSNGSVTSTSSGIVSGNASSNVTISSTNEDSDNNPNNNDTAATNMGHSNVSSASINVSSTFENMLTPSDYVDPRSTTSTISSTLSLNDYAPGKQTGGKLTSTNNNLIPALPLGSTASVPHSTTSTNGTTGYFSNNTYGNSNDVLKSYTSRYSNTNFGTKTDQTGIQSIMESKKSHILTGTPMYMSPETIKGDNSGKFGCMDIWSLGCCILEMATGRRPWSNLDNEFAVMYHIAAGHLPQFPSHTELSAQGQEFLAKCLTIDPQKRATAVELLQDPWIQSIRNEAFSDVGVLNVNETSSGE